MVQFDVSLQKPSSAGKGAAPSGLAEGEHSLHVPGHCDQAPLSLHLLEAAQVELSKAHDRLDDSEHGLRRLLAQRIELAAFQRRQPILHRLHRRRSSGSGGAAAKRSFQDRLWRSRPGAISGVIRVSAQASTLAWLK